MLAFINLRDIHVSVRQRTVVEHEPLKRLADSIVADGLLHPIGVVKSSDPHATSEYELIYGERRLKAIDLLYVAKRQYRYGNIPVQIGLIPCTVYEGASDLFAAELEFDENEHREALSWQDRAYAMATLVRLREKELTGVMPEKTPQSPAHTPVNIAALARDIAPTAQQTPRAVQNQLNAAMLVAEHLDDPNVRGAANLNTAAEYVRRKIESEFAAQLQKAQPAQVAKHIFIGGDCRVELAKLPAASIDSIISDPPYGQGIGDRLAARHTGHQLDAPAQEAFETYDTILREGFRIVKPAGHIWLFCDIDFFCDLRSAAVRYGWEPIHTPIVWNKVRPTNACRDKYGLSRQFELILHASKGLRPLREGKGDVISLPYEAGILKPPALYEYIMKWSCVEGSIFLDPCCGQGTIFEAARLAKMRAVGIERNPSLFAQNEAGAIEKWVSPCDGTAAPGTPSSNQLLADL